MISIADLPATLFQPLPKRAISQRAQTVAVFRLLHPKSKRAWELAICESYVQVRRKSSPNSSWTRWSYNTYSDHAKAIEQARQMIDKVEEQGYGAPISSPIFVPMTWANLTHLRDAGRISNDVINWASGLYDRIEEHVASIKAENIPDTPTSTDGELSGLLSSLDQNVDQIEELSKKVGSGT